MILNNRSWSWEFEVNDGDDGERFIELSKKKFLKKKV